MSTNSPKVGLSHTVGIKEQFATPAHGFTIIDELLLLLGGEKDDDEEELPPLEEDDEDCCPALEDDDEYDEELLLDDDGGNGSQGQERHEHPVHWADACHAAKLLLEQSSNITILIFLYHSSAGSLL